MTQAPGPTVPLPRRPSPPGDADPAASTRLLLVALGVALLAVLLVNLYIYSVKQSVAEGEFQFFRLRVAKEVGSTLAADDVEPVGVPERFRDAFRDVVEPNDQGEPLRLGDTFTRAAELGEPLTTRMFDDLTGDPTRTLVRDGYRGVALPVVSKSLPDPLKPEMRVDLIAPFRGPGGNRVPLVVMENVRVVSVGERNIVDEQRQDGGRFGGSFETLTIEVRPQEAVLLEEITEAVSAIGAYTVLIRNPDDTSPVFVTDGGINPRVLEDLGLTGTSSEGAAGR